MSNADLFSLIIGGALLWNSLTLIVYGRSTFWFGFCGAVGIILSAVPIGVALHHMGVLPQ